MKMVSFVSLQADFHVIVFCAVPGMPRNLAITVDGPNSLTASWLEPAVLNGVLMHYLVNVSTTSGLTNSMTNSTTFTADSLTPFTDYTFEVAGVTGAGAGPSISMTSTTAQAGESKPTLR